MLGSLGKTRSSWLREVMSSLMKTLGKWYLTVRGLMNSRAPISGFESPSRASRAICLSWAVKRRRIHARAQLRIAHDMLDTMGIEAFAKRAANCWLRARLSANAGWKHATNSRGARAGLSAGHAADLLFGLLSPELYLIFVRDRGWTPEAWERWAHETLTAQLCADGPG